MIIDHQKEKDTVCKILALSTLKGDYTQIQKEGWMLEKPNNSDQQ